MALFRFGPLWRRGVRKRFVEYLRAHYPEYDVVRVTPGSVFCTTAEGGEMELVLHRLYGRAAGARTSEDELVVFTEWMTAMGEFTTDGDTLSLERDGERLRPMLAAPEKRAGFPDGATAPFTALPGLGLEVLYVVDSERSVMYVTAAHLAELGLDTAAVHERALANLRGSFPPNGVREAIANRTPVLVQSLDGYDAARLLLLPAYLEDGEVLAAAIPDRDCLGFRVADEGFDWSGVEKLARTPTGQHLLLNRPVAVTREGFQVR